jgi:eukaryotic-like serine/threonine-protein kinase
MGELGGASTAENYPHPTEQCATLRDRVLERIRKGEDFPATSASVSLITQLTTANEASITELANIILTDIGLTTKILKLLNSVFYMRFGEVTTISRAIILLGLENLRNIALSLTLFDKLRRKNSRLLIDLMAKAVYAGILGRKVADKIGSVNSEEGFICSLFRNLGEILIAYYDPEEAAQIEENSPENRQEVHTKNERTVLEASCQEIGMIIAKEWSLPDMIILCMKKVYSAEVLTNPGPLEKLRYISAISSQIADIMETARDSKKTHIRSLIESFGKQFEKLNDAIETIIP